MRGARIIIFLYAALAVLLVPVFPHFLSPNEFSRWIVDAAIIDYHTLEVTAVNALFGGRIQDLSEVRGHQYSNKAPGVSLVGLPAYALARAMSGPPRAATMRFTLTAMRWLASTLPTILLAWFMLRAAERFGVSDESLRWTVAILLFATPLFAYGMLLFSHALAAFALFGGWVLLFTDTFGRRPLLAGAMMGLAVLSEYTSAVVAIIFVVCAGFSSRKDLLRFMAGGFPFLVVLLLYNQIAFGNPFNVSYTFTEHADYRALARSGLFGVHAPSAGTMALLLFDLSRGLLVLSPVLLVAAFGAKEARRQAGGIAFWSLILAPIALLLVFGGYPYWHGGWGIGARYLVPALPFVVFLIAFSRLPAAPAVLMGMSVAAVTTVSLVFPFVPPNAFPLPWGSLAWPLLRDGLVAPNLLHLAARSLAVVVPFLLVIAAVGIAVPRRWWIASAAGAAVMMAIGIVYAGRTEQWTMPRAYFEEVYFDQPGALHRKLPDVPLQPAIVRHMQNELESPPPTWPF